MLWVWSNHFSKNRYVKLYTKKKRILSKGYLETSRIEAAVN